MRMSTVVVRPERPMPREPLFYGLAYWQVPLVQSNRPAWWNKQNAAYLTSAKIQKMIWINA